MSALVERKPIYSSIDQLPDAKESRATARALVEVTSSLAVIDDPEKASRAAEWLARARAHWTAVDTLRKNMNAGARQAMELLNAEFAQVLEPLKHEIDGMALLIQAFTNRQRQQAEEARRAAETAERERQRQIEAERKAAEAKGKEPPPPPPPPPPVVMQEAPRRIAGHAGSSVTERDNWTYEIEDISLVPEQFLVPPAERVQKSILNALARAQKGDAKVPGIRFVNKPVLATRAAR